MPTTAVRSVEDEINIGEQFIFDSIAAMDANDCGAFRRGRNQHWRTVHFRLHCRHGCQRLRCVPSRTKSTLENSSFSTPLPPWMPTTAVRSVEDEINIGEQFIFDSIAAMDANDC